MSVEHLFPTLHIKFRYIVAIRTRQSCFFKRLKVLLGASTNIGCTHCDEFFSVTVIYLHLVGSVNHDVGGCTKPFTILEVPRVRFKHWPLRLRVGIIKTQNKCTVVSSSAVSYTHLRAHETDSYLVCRLLLEKKKKKIYL